MRSRGASAKSAFKLPICTLDSFFLHHRDPFDRLLIAQANQEGLTLVTHDPKFSVYSVSLLG